MTVGSNPSLLNCILKIGALGCLSFLVSCGDGDATDSQGNQGESLRKTSRASSLASNEITATDSDVAGRPFISLVLPTGNDQIFGDPTKFYMYTNRNFEGVRSKPWQGGQYGFVRNQRRTDFGIVFTRLHEGMDIRPLQRDRNGEPLDDVRSISHGTVVYVNDSASASSYGKYVVVQHDWHEGAFYSLYAHLASCSVTEETPVRAGDKLGRLGYTGSGIDQERAHLHIELAFMLSNRFKTWYGEHYTSKNHHGIFNGFNLVGMDIARLFIEHRKNPAITVRELLEAEEPYYRVVTPTRQMPGILSRHPWLGRDMDGARQAKSWEFTFARSGVPLSIKPSSRDLRYPAVTWVKPAKVNHSYLTVGRISGYGDKAALTARGSQYIQLISESF